MSDARPEAVAHMAHAMSQRWLDEGLTNNSDPEFDAECALDAIPAHVLAHLAIERGALEACGWRWREPTFGSWVAHHWKPEDYDTLTPPTPVYRIVPAGEGE